MRNDYYVYAYYEKDSAVPFYIGKGCGDRDKSIDHNIAVSNKIQKVGGWQEIDIQRLSENLTEIEAFQVEKQFIILYGRVPDGPLLNLTDGGEGSSGRCPTFQQRQKQKEKMMGKISVRRRRIACYTSVLIEKFDCISDVEKHGYSRNRVGECLNGQKSLAYGMRWEYINE